jgi:hypothetical protein
MYFLYNILLNAEIHNAAGAGNCYHGLLKDDVCSYKMNSKMARYETKDELEGIVKVTAFI